MLTTVLSFTPLVFSIHGAMGREFKTFYSRLATLISDKRKTPSSITSSWIRTKVGFALLKSSLLCLRGSRALTHNVCNNIGDDIILDHAMSRLTNITNIQRQSFQHGFLCLRLCNQYLQYDAFQASRTTDADVCRSENCKT